MNDLKGFLSELIKLSIFDPRQAARTVLDLQFGREILWMMALLVVLLSVLLTYVTMVAAGGSAVMMMGIAQSPMLLAIFMAANMVFLIFALLFTGKALGGLGTLEGVIAVITWLQTLLLLAQVIQTILAPFSPSLSSTFGTASLLYALWIMIQFITEAHGFTHWSRGLAVLVLGVLGVAAGISLILGVIGVSTVGLSSYV